MIKRPVRTLITEPLTRCGVVDEDWKYIVASTILTLVLSMIFVDSFWLMLLLTPSVFVTGVVLSVTLHKRRPPRWAQHKAIFLLRRLEAMLFNRHPAIRSPLPGVETPLLALPRADSPATEFARAKPQEPPRQRAMTRFDALELLPQAREFTEELTY